MPDDANSGWYSNESATFGDRLAAAREQAGLTQAELADRIGVKGATLRAWEEDMKEPRANRLSMLSGMLNISLSWLMTGEGEGPAGPPDDEPISADVATLLSDIRATRVEMVQATDKLARLEKKLRRALQDA